MTTLDLLGSLHAQGVLLIAKGDRLAFDAPAGVLTPDLRALLTSRKSEILMVLTGDWPAAASVLIAQVRDCEIHDDLLYLFEERAGICEFDGNMPRGDAERMAYEQLARAVDGAADAPMHHSLR